MLESFGPNKKNTLVTNSLNKQTCLAEPRWCINYTDWQGEQIQNNESSNKLRTCEFLLRQELHWILKPNSSKQEKQRGRAAVKQQETHSGWDSHAALWQYEQAAHPAGTTKEEPVDWLHTIPICSRVSIMHAVNGHYILWCNLIYHQIPCRWSRCKLFTYSFCIPDSNM